jgi:hypothetical protein
LSTKTTNLKLTKPELTDAADITAMNENWDKIDVELKNRTPYLATYYPPNTMKNADELVDAFALIPINSEVNSELFNILGGTFAWVWTNFYIEASVTTRRTQIAMTYNNVNHKIAFRIYGTNGWLEWTELAAANHKHDVEDISGTLPIERGGTGATTVAGVLQKLGLSKAITAIEVDTSSTAPSYALDPSNTNVEKRYLASNGLTSITLTKGSFSNDTEYHVTIVFKSGTTATTITNTAGVYFTGDDCKDGVLTPVKNKVYELGIWWNGLSLQGVVRGV